MKTRQLTSGFVAARARNQVEALPKNIPPEVRIEHRAQRATDLSLSRRLHFARIKALPLVIVLLQVAVSLGTWFALRPWCGVVLQILCIGVGPVFINGWINRLIEKRTNAFDRDYPQFLLSVVGLLKTGLTPLHAVEAASRGLDEMSLLRQEVEDMLERLRYGVAEDIAVGGFGDSILHTEVELFIQALILSKRVGGQLSETLERLAKQVRKRQAFRAQAQAAVSMQRGSVWIIIGIMGLLMVYMAYMNPAMIVAVQKDSSSRSVVEVAISLIIAAILWIRRVTNIKL
jgi:tight adherence protein B